MVLRNEPQISTNPRKNVLGKDWGKGKEVRLTKRNMGKKGRTGRQNFC